MMPLIIIPTLEPVEKSGTGPSPRFLVDLSAVEFALVRGRSPNHLYCPVESIDDKGIPSFSYRR